MDKIPWSLETSYYPMSLVDQGAAELAWAEFIYPGTLPCLKKTLGLEQIGYRDRFLTGPPDESEIRFSGMPDDGRVPVIAVLRTGCSGGAVQLLCGQRGLSVRRKITHVIPGASARITCHCPGGARDRGQEAAAGARLCGKDDPAETGVTPRRSAVSRYFMIRKALVRLAVPDPSRSWESCPGTRPARRREAGAG